MFVLKCTCLRRFRHAFLASGLVRDDDLTAVWWPGWRGSRGLGPCTVFLESSAGLSVGLRCVSVCTYQYMYVCTSVPTGITPEPKVEVLRLVKAEQRHFFVLRLLDCSSTRGPAPHPPLSPLEPGVCGQPGRRASTWALVQQSWAAGLCASCAARCQTQSGQEMVLAFSRS